MGEVEASFRLAEGPNRHADNDLVDSPTRRSWLELAQPLSRRLKNFFCRAYNVRPSIAESQEKCVENGGFVIK